jgi:hypothetical protein
MVIVEAKGGIDLECLAKGNGPLSISCGSLGNSMAKKLLEGKGRAVIKRSDLTLMIDTQDSLEVILENFILTDKESQLPLFFKLLKDSVG